MGCLDMELGGRSQIHLNCSENENVCKPLDSYLHDQVRREPLAGGFAGIPARITYDPRNEYFGVARHVGMTVNPQLGMVFLDDALQPAGERRIQWVALVLLGNRWRRR